MTLTRHPSTQTQHVASRLLLTRLQAEWNTLAVRPAAIRQARGWNLVVVEFADLNELLHHAGLGGTADDRRADELMASLIVLARDDDLAARLVLQRLLPALSVIARRRSPSFFDSLAALDELLSAAWPVIRSFDLGAQQRYVVARLVRKCEYRAFNRSRRKWVCEPTQPEQLDVAVEQQPVSEPLCELLGVLREARQRGLSDDDLRVVRALISSPTANEAAGLLNVTPRTLRAHREAIAYRLRQAVTAA